MENNISIDQISKLIQCKEDQSIARFNNLNLYTAVQPIFSLAHKRIIGYEALVRVKDDSKRWISPASLFTKKYEISEAILLDRLCRYLHIDNFSKKNNDINWLFLNVSPQTIIKGKYFGQFFSQLLEKFNLPPHRIVIEIVEYPIENNELLLENINYYKDIGCLIAIDDFGAGHSNFDRIWTLNPDIVKLDRSFLLKASKEKKIQKLLSGIVSLLHQTGSLVLIEGIENKEETMIALESGVDFVQGYYFAKPSLDIESSSKINLSLEDIFLDYKKNELKKEKVNKKEYNKYKEFLSIIINKIKKGYSFKKSCQFILNEDEVIRCYLLKPNGVQIGDTIASNSLVNGDIRFKPLYDTNSADWFRKPYLKNALLHPNQLQVSDPYLSITGAHMCLTLSIMFSTEGGDKVLCCDLSY
ncbi:EAL domain-containing protein [Halonatronum saccharophilum]|uniref:EAL domain-containing protein n=1 Tax=Halonatronum saccharophilum TaxID=150060 RepID=UPI0004AD1C61|nr:EAL domain-containing protein [Halonatronum saccharophilum]